MKRAFMRPLHSETYPKCSSHFSAIVDGRLPHGDWQQSNRPLKFDRLLVGSVEFTSSYIATMIDELRPNTRLIFRRKSRPRNTGLNMRMASVGISRSIAI